MTKTRKTLSKTQGVVDEKAGIENDKFIVVSTFLDRTDPKKNWKEGDDVSHFDEARLKSAIERGLVKKG